MTDIIKELRGPYCPDTTKGYLRFEAADEIERLRVALADIAVTGRTIKEAQSIACLAINHPMHQTSDKGTEK